MRRLGGILLLVAAVLAEEKPAPIPCPRVADTPRIDGRLAEEAWRSAPALALDRPDQVHPEYRDGWTGPDDLSATARVLVSGDALYLGLEVADETLLHEADRAWWVGDSIEVFFDTDRASDEPADAYSDDDLQLFLLPLHPDLRWGVVGRRAAVSYPDGGLDGLVVATTRTARGYIVEAKLPLHNLRPLRPDADGCIGFDLALNDVDGPGRTRAETYLTLSGRFDLFRLPGNFGRLAIADALRNPGAAPRPATWRGLGAWASWIAALAAVIALAWLGGRAARRARTRTRTWSVACVLAAAALAGAPWLVAWIDEQATRARWAEEIERVQAAAAGHAALDARPPEERAERLAALFRDGHVRIAPHYRYHFVPTSDRARAAPVDATAPGAIDYGLVVAPGETRRIALDPAPAPARLRLDLALPAPDDQRDAARPAATVAFHFAEGPPLTATVPGRHAGPLLLDAGERAGTPLRALVVGNRLPFRALEVAALYGRAGGGTWRPLPLPARTRGGVPVDVAADRPASHLAPVPTGGALTVPVGAAAHRAWIALRADGAYPHTPWGAEAVRIEARYRDGAPGPARSLANGADLRDHVLRHRFDPAAFMWETPAGVPQHYTLHALPLDPGRPLAELVVTDLGVLRRLQVAAVTLGVRTAERPPPGAGLDLAGDRLALRPSVRAVLASVDIAVHGPDRRTHGASDADGVVVTRALPYEDGAPGRLAFTLPRGGLAAALLAHRAWFLGCAGLLATFAGVLLGAALLHRARRLRVKMLVAVGAAAAAPLLFLGVGLTVLLNERAESDLERATRHDVRRAREHLASARVRAREMADRARDTLEFVVPRGAAALRPQIDRVRRDVADAGGFLRVPDLDAAGPSPLGNAAFVDAAPRSGLYYSPWDGLLALGIARSPARRRYVAGVGGADLLRDLAGDDVAFVLYGPHGRPLAGAPAGAAPVDPEAIGPDEVRYAARVPFDDGSAAAAHALLRDDGRVVGVLGVYRSRAATDGTLAAIDRTMLVSGLAALLLVALAGGALVGRVADRLQRVTRAARALAQGDLSRRVPATGDDEVGRLARSFNRMADALDARVRQLTDLHEGLQQLTTGLDLAEVARAAALLLGKATDTAHVVVAAYDRTAETLEPLHRLGEGATIGGRLPARGPERDAIAGGRPVVRAGAVYVPLMASGRAVGLAVCSPLHDPGALDETFLDASGRQIGIALENARLFHAAVTDELTGVYTYAFFVRRLREEVDRAAATERPLALLRVVLDDFPAFALRHGAAIAAQVVAETAAVLGRTLPRRDMIARRDAGELVVLLVETGAADARARRERVARALADHAFDALAGERPPAFTYRTATYPEDGAGADMLLDVLFAGAETWDGAGARAATPLAVPAHLGVHLGRSAGMRAALDVVARVAPTQATVLLGGETGTGKEVLADLVHANSDRRERPLVKVNCAAIPEALLESELFGHERGAFTGAERRRLGRFELAHRGTIFLDEVGDLPLAMQAKLLRVVQERRFTRVGGDRPVEVDVRILAATNRDLQDAVRQGAFREDLYHRLHVIELVVPPLRERREDIAALVEHFRREFNARHRLAVTAFAPDALDALYRHDWPGNVRELRNVVERSMLLTHGETVDRAHLALPDDGAAEDGGTPPVRVEGLTPRQERILRIARRDGSVTNGDVVQQEDVSARTALRELQRLVERGLLLRVGRRRGAVYRPAT